jgi:hypothetical protein
MGNYKFWALIPATVALLCLIGGIVIAMRMYREGGGDGDDDTEHVAVVVENRSRGSRALTLTQQSRLQSNVDQGTSLRPRAQQLSPAVTVAVAQPTAPEPEPAFAPAAPPAPAAVSVDVHLPPPDVSPLQVGAVAQRGVGGGAAAAAGQTPWQLAQHAALAEKAAAVIPRPPPREPLMIENKLDISRKLSKFTFQSDQRDIQMYPLESYYRLQLDIPLRNVIGVYMNNAVIPISEPNVNVFNHWIDIDVGGTLYEVQIPEGEYNELTLAPAIQAAIQAMGGPLAAFTVSLSPITRSLTVNTNGPPCIIKWRTGPNVNRSMWMVMGFPRVDTPDTVIHVAPGIIDISGVPAIDVFIEEVKSSINSVDNCFVRIPMQRFAPTSTITYFTFTTAGLPVTFWPIARLQYLTFNFLVKTTILLPNGDIVVKYRPYDFKQRQHTFQLTFETKEYKNVFEDFVELDPQS